MIFNFLTSDIHSKISLLTVLHTCYHGYLHSDPQISAQCPQEHCPSRNRCREDHHLKPYKYGTVSKDWKKHVNLYLRTLGYASDKIEKMKISLIISRIEMLLWANVAMRLYFKADCRLTGVWLKWQSLSPNLSSFRKSQNLELGAGVKKIHFIYYFELV